MKNIFFSDENKSSKNDSNQIKEEIISYDEYQKLIETGRIDNIKEITIIPPKLNKPETTVKVRYKKPENRKKRKTKRVVHDRRRLKMNNPNL